MGYHKEENKKFELLVAEMGYFLDHPLSQDFSSSFPPELAGVVGGLGGGLVGVGAVFAALTGLSGSELTAALAAAGGGAIAAGGLGVAGGVAAIAGAAFVPAAVVGGGLYYLAKKNEKHHKLKHELKSLIKQSYKFEAALKTDKRENVKGLLIAVREMRNSLLEKHDGLRSSLFSEIFKRSKCQVCQRDLEGGKFSKFESSEKVHVFCPHCGSINSVLIEKIE